jgi:predicted nucleic acid-binding protein
LIRAGLLEGWVSPAILEEYRDVLNEHPDLLEELFFVCHSVLPIVEVGLIRHQPDNRFLECAFAADVDYLVTVNTARGHFERKDYEGVRVVTPSEFLNLPQVLSLLPRLTHG